MDHNLSTKRCKKIGNDRASEKLHTLVSMFVEEYGYPSLVSGRDAAAQLYIESLPRIRRRLSNKDVRKRAN
jgi:hypothetical protein